MLGKVIVAVSAGFLLGVFAGGFSASRHIQKTEDGVITPYVDLSHYTAWSLPDSLSLCGPDGYCTEMPHGTLILTPLPETVPPPIMD